MSMKLTVEEVSRWTVGEVAAHFRSEEGQVVDKSAVALLVENGVDGTRLLSLSKKGLSDLGVGKSSGRNAILKFIEEVRLTVPPSLSSSSSSSSVLSPASTKFGVCARHAIPFEFFCETCDKLLCPKCVQKRHSDHEIHPVAERVGAIKEEMQTLVEKLAGQSNHIDMVLSECESALGKLSSASATAIEEINLTRDRLIEDIQIASENAIAQVKQHEVLKVSYLGQKRAENTALKKEIDSLHHDMARRLREENPVEALQHREEFKDACQLLLGEAKSRSIAQLDDMYAVGVRFEEDDVFEITNLARNSIFRISANGSPQLTQGVLAFGTVVQGPTTRIVVVGGSAHPQQFRTAEMYDDTAKRWTRLPDMLFERGSQPAIASANNKIYVAGGKDTQNRILASFEVLDLSSMTWSAQPPMDTKRRGLSGVFLPGETRLMVTGGKSDWRLVSCEVFDTTSNTWSTSVASLSVFRVDHCTVLFRGSPVVIGGDDGDQPLSSCEEYDIAANKWNSFPSLNIPRCGFGAAVLGDKIYVAGGYDGLDGLEVFDGSQWCMISPSLARVRQLCAAVNLGGKLVLGGDSAANVDVEVYDPSSESIRAGLIPAMVYNPKRAMLAAVSF